MRHRKTRLHARRRRHVPTNWRLVKECKHCHSLQEVATFHNKRHATPFLKKLPSSRTYTYRLTRGFIY